MGLLTHRLGRRGEAFLTSRVLKRIPEGSFKVNMVPEPTCLPHHLPQPQPAWCYVGPLEEVPALGMGRLHSTSF